ncbi:MAG: helix-turn-helix transcriptional regulator [Bacteroidales bacterium]|nr:helix-turn-helix transcriptional regulator [Bacteroidales bacterium]
MQNNLKVERARRRISQQELADKVAASRQTINAIELGKFNPSTVLALKISKVFDISVNELFYLEEGD